MKIREGFISNSSSSSFIVINCNSDVISDREIGRYQYCIKNNTLDISEIDGEEEFGWIIGNHYEFGSKLKFCILMIHYEQNLDWLKMLTDVLSSKLKFNKIKYDEFVENGYIDHQSVTEENQRMFDSIEVLQHFLYNPNSYIHTDNDNY